ncbi:hypothetical protein OSTOST_02108 [Ostertagia ostertagi]
MEMIDLTNKKKEHSHIFIGLKDGTSWVDGSSVEHARSIGTDVLLRINATISMMNRVMEQRLSRSMIVMRRTSTTMTLLFAESDSG